MNIHGLTRLFSAVTFFRLLTIVCLHGCLPLAAQQPGQVLPGQDGDATKTTTLPRHSQTLEALRKVLESDDRVREKLAREAEDDGRSELAEWLRSDLDSDDGRKSLELASESVKNGDWVTAIHAYLAAYEANPDLLQAEHLPAFRKAGRMVELARSFDESKIERLTFRQGLSPLKIVEVLIADPGTKTEGFELLKRVFRAQGYQSPISLRIGRARLDWKEVPDPLFYLRAVFIPKDFAEEVEGWGRLSVQTYREETGEASGPLTSMVPLYHDRDALRQLAGEVRGQLDKHPKWLAGWALLAFLEAELGNCSEATKLLSEHFVDSNGEAIPTHAAWMLGIALEGRDTDLDQVVIKLLERGVETMASQDFERPAGSTGPLYGEPLRVSPISRLVRLYAKYGRGLEARQLLYGLVDSNDQHPLVQGYLPGIRGKCNWRGRCTECHREEKNYFDFMVMTDGMTDIGYPVDSLLALARIDASFGNAFTSSGGRGDTGSDERKEMGRIISRGSIPRYFTEQKVKAGNAITPQSVIESLELGSFRRSTRYDKARLDKALELIRTIHGDDEKSLGLVELADRLDAEKSTEQVAALDLMLSVRSEGKNAKATVFSPVIDILKLAVNAQAPQVNEDIAELDQKLVNLAETESGGIEAGIAATVFAFLRYDFDAAAVRMKRLQELRSAGAKEPQRSDLGLWLVARYALADDRTRTLGEPFANRAIAAAEKQPDPRWRQAMLREQKVMMNQADK